MCVEGIISGCRWFILRTDVNTPAALPTSPFSQGGISFFTLCIKWAVTFNRLLSNSLFRLWIEPKRSKLSPPVLPVFLPHSELNHKALAPIFLTQIWNFPKMFNDHFKHIIHSNNLWFIFIFVFLQSEKWNLADKETRELKLTLAQQRRRSRMVSLAKTVLSRARRLFFCGTICFEPNVCMPSVVVVDRK